MTCLVLLTLLAGCSAEPDLTPVPTTASAPYACDGVPRASAELITGEPVTADVSNHNWGDDDMAFLCSLVSEHGLVQVEETPVDQGFHWGRTEESVIAGMQATTDDPPLQLDAPGTGYTWGGHSAGWVCNGRLIIVALGGDPVPGRDWPTDATNLLASMLPWACNGEDVPEATDDQTN